MVIIIYKMLCVITTNQVQPVNTKIEQYVEQAKHAYEKFNPQLEEKEKRIRRIRSDESGYSQRSSNTP